jgi:hypothetical protein
MKVLTMVMVLAMYHLLVCLIASFVTWEIVLFNIDEWNSGARFCYLFIGIALGLAVITSD